MQVALAMTSTVLMLVSIVAYKRKSEGRYLLLMLAFVFFCIASVSNMALAFFVGWEPTVVPFFEIYLIPSLELLMVVSFLVALVWSSKRERRFSAILLEAMLSFGLVGSTAYIIE
jgi:hypothetical protein